MDGKRRTVAQVIEPDETFDGAGVKLHRSIAGRAINYLDPFLLFDHFGSDDPNDYIAGFPMHPHRGIETVTYMIDGVVRHRDSMGHAGEVGQGDIQWMTAGHGILHEEMPQIKGGRLEGFQLWVNLPANAKMMKPRYQEVAAHSIPEIHEDGGAAIRVIAGRVGDVRGAVTEIAADPEYLDVAVEPRGIVTPLIAVGHTAFAYVFRGEGEFGVDDEGRGRTVAAPKLIIFSDGELLEVRAGKEGVRFLLVSGKPLHEPVARYGPFVMNTREEIEQTLRDLHDGTFEWHGE